MPMFQIIDKAPGGHTGKIGAGGGGEAVEIWAILADSPFYSTEDLRRSGVFPEPYVSFHPQNARLRLMPAEIEQHEESPELFKVTLTFTSDPLSPEQEKEKDEDKDDPLDRRPHITVDTTMASQFKFRDFYGKPFFNAVGDMFDPVPESHQSYLIIRIRKNVTVFPDWIFDFIDATNSIPFQIKGRTIDTGCAWIASIRLGEGKTDATYPYCESEVEIHVKKRRKPFDRADGVTAERPEDVPDPWQLEILNEGFYQLDPSEDSDPAGPPIITYDKRRIFVKVPSDAPVGTPMLQPSAIPVPLSKKGKALQPFTLGQENYIVFRIHEEKDFNEIAPYLWSNA